MNSARTRAARDFFAQKLAYVTGPVELDAMIRRLEAITVVDVRLPEDFREGHVPGAINLPQGRWHTLDGLSTDRTAVLYGYTPTCQLATAAAVELAARGIPVVEMQGGFDTWNAYGLPVESGATA
jgi:rhodanese-related sulfurtransferase